MLDTLMKIGPFLSGIGVISAAGVGLATLILYTLKQRHDNWLKAFGDIFERFWMDKEVADIRRCVTNDLEYSKIEEVLSKRNKAARNDLSEEENDIIEKIDRFCLTLMRVKYFGEIQTGTPQNKFWTRSFQEFWINKIKERQELANYIGRFWKGVSL